MRRLTSVLRHRLRMARCPAGCYCVKDRFVWRCTECHHIC